MHCVKLLELLKQEAVQMGGEFWMVQSLKSFVGSCQKINHKIAETGHETELI